MTPLQNEKEKKGMILDFKKNDSFFRTLNPHHSTEETAERIRFDSKMSFAPQRRTLFRHLNFQKRSEAEVFCTF